MKRTYSYELALSLLDEFDEDMSGLFENTCLYEEPIKHSKYQDSNETSPNVVIENETSCGIDEDTLAVVTSLMKLSVRDFFDETNDMERTKYAITKIEGKVHVEGTIHFRKMSIDEQADKDFESPSSFEDVMKISGKSSSAIVVTDPNEPFIIRHVNKSWVDLCGYNENEVVGKCLKMIQGKETNTKKLNTLKEKALSKEQHAVDLINYTKAGRPFRNHLRIKPLKDRFLLGVLQEKRAI